jgi:hypothetical protein
MFNPAHDRVQVGDTGEFLGGDSGVTEGQVNDIEEHADRRGQVGHTQKMARARDEDFDPQILRRSEEITTYDGSPGLNFTSVQRRIADFVETRKAMNGDAIENAVGPEYNVILGHIEVTNRANFLVPPRRLRALPAPRGNP